MARKRTAAQAKPDTVDATPDTGPAMTPAGDDVPEPAHAADPRPVVSVSLSDYQGGPSMRLLRSHRFRQMQIRFDGEQPAERHLARLKQAGWTDRTESEGVWTKQIDPDARWQSVRHMEGEFKEIANAIREAKGMKPVLEGLSVP